MPDVGDDELDDLTLHISHTGKLWEPIELWSLKVFIVQTHQVEIKGEAYLKFNDFLNKSMSYD